MNKEGLILEFNELHSSKVLKDLDFIDIVRDSKIKRYKIIDTKEKLFEYLSKSTKYAENKMEILVTFECTNISGIFHNAIFLEKFKIDSYSEPKLEDSLYLSFTNCDFFEGIELLGGDYKRIKINKSIIRKSIFVRFINCEKSRINNVIFK